MTHNILRTLTLVAALTAAGAAFAASSKQSANEAAADCTNRATIQYGIDTAGCSPFPTYSGAYADCMSGAAMKYSQAIAACAQASATAGPRRLGPVSGPRLTVLQGG